MKFAIDVIYLDRSKKVTKVRSAMKPWRLSLSLSARSVLELPAGTAQRTRTQPGDQLSFEKLAAVAVAFIALTFTGCVKQQTTAFHAPVTSFDRQIRNAVDAGDGDFQLAQLREKVIASPTDITSRLQLGAAYEAKGYPELALDHYRLAIAQSRLFLPGTRGRASPPTRSSLHIIPKSRPFTSPGSAFCKTKPAIGKQAKRLTAPPPNAPAS